MRCSKPCIHKLLMNLTQKNAVLFTQSVELSGTLIASVTGQQQLNLIIY